MVCKWGQQVLLKIAFCTCGLVNTESPKIGCRPDHFGSPQKSVNQEMADKFMSLGMATDDSYIVLISNNI